MRLETERLVLRRPRLADAAAIVDLYSDPVAMEFIGGVPDPETFDARAIVGRWLEQWEANGFGLCVAELRGEQAFVGRVGLVVWDTSIWRITSLPEAGEHAQPELGWALARAHWGRGYATEAASAVRDWARRELGIGRLVSVIAPDNVRSIRVAEKLGAVPGETVQLRSAYVGPAVVWEHPG